MRDILVTLVIVVLFSCALLEVDSSLSEESGVQAKSRRLTRTEKPKMWFSWSSVGESASARVRGIEGEEAIVSIEKGLRITPTSISFGEQPLCVMKSATFTIETTVADAVSEVEIPSSTSPSFHPTFVSDETDGPKSLASGQVVFLPRVVGPVRGHVVLKTSNGVFFIPVDGIGVPNRYELYPLLGLRKAPEATLEVPVTLYNPHDEELKVEEVYASQQFLSLSLPKGVGMHAWKIPPKHELTVIVLRFSESNSGRYHGFINLSTSHDKFVIHVDVNVMKSGLHWAFEKLDFGMVTDEESEAAEDIVLVNTGDNEAVIVREGVVSPSEPSVRLFINRGLVIPPGTQATVGKVVLSGRKEGYFAGKIAIYTNDTRSTETAYFARVIYGGLWCHREDASFLLGSQSVERPFRLMNQFGTPLFVYSIDVDDRGFEVCNSFVCSLHLLKTSKISSFPSTGFSVESYGEATQFNVISPVDEDSVLRATVMHVRTNLTEMDLPLIAYSGRLVYGVSDISDNIYALVKSDSESVVLDFGYVEVGKTYYIRFQLGNSNPVVVNMYNWKMPNLTKVIMSVDGVVDGGCHGAFRSTDSQFIGNSGRFRRLELKPGEFLCFTAEVKSMKEEEINGELVIKTDFERIGIPVRFSSIIGTLRLSPSPISFGGIVGVERKSVSLVAESSYAIPVSIVGSTSSDPRFVLRVENDVVVEPNSKRMIGTVTLMENLDGNPIVMDSSSPCAENMFRRPYIDECDIHELETLARGWNYDDDSIELSGSVSVMTNVSRTFTVDSFGIVSRPRVVDVDVLNFDIEQVGKNISKLLVVHNPSPLPLAVRFLDAFELDLCYVGSALDILNRSDAMSRILKKDGHSAFSIDGVMTVLPPYSSASVGAIMFHPQGVGDFRSLVFVKNNLTVIETFEVKGRGGSGVMFFQEEDEKNVTDILMQITEAEGKDIILGKKDVVPIQKTIFVRNGGDLDLTVSEVLIAGRPCSKFGISVSECGPFSVGVGGKRVLTISYIPDFTVSELKTSLIFFSPFGEHRIPFVATIPPHLLPELYAVSSVSPSTFSRLSFAIVVLSLSLFVVWRTSVSCMGASVRAQKLSKDLLLFSRDETEISQSESGAIEIPEFHETDSMEGESAVDHFHDFDGEIKETLKDEQGSTESLEKWNVYGTEDSKEEKSYVSSINIEDTHNEDGETRDELIIPSTETSPPDSPEYNQHGFESAPVTPGERSAAESVESFGQSKSSEESNQKDTVPLRVSKNKVKEKERKSTRSGRKHRNSRGKKDKQSNRQNGSLPPRPPVSNDSAKKEEVSPLKTPVSRPHAAQTPKVEEELMNRKMRIPTLSFSEKNDTGMGIVPPINAQRSPESPPRPEVTEIRGMLDELSYRRPSVDSYPFSLFGPATSSAFGTSLLGGSVSRNDGDGSTGQGDVFSLFYSSTSPPPSGLRSASGDVNARPVPKTNAQDPFAVNPRGSDGFNSMFLNTYFNRGNKNGDQL